MSDVVVGMSIGGVVMAVVLMAWVFDFMDAHNLPVRPQDSRRIKKALDGYKGERK